LNNRGDTDMRRKISVVLCVLLTMIYAVIPNFTAKAEDLTVTGVPSQIKVGDTFTVSIAVPKNIGGSVYVAYSKENLKVTSSPGSDVGTGLTSYTAFFNSSTESVAFEATAAGSATVSVYMTDAEYSDKDPSEALPTIPKITKTITIVNEVAPPASENPGNTEQPPKKSDDNSLVSLKLSSGTLSPAFKGNVTKYTATVGYDVTKVVVSAKTSSSKATIESVTGNGTVNLNVGENTIQIVVKAENGTKATYTIVVTRKAQEATAPQPSGSEQPSESETPPEVNEILQWNGEQLQVADKIPEESIPTDFESKLLVVNGQQMQGLSFANGDLKVLYLNNTNGAGSLYVYDEALETIYPFIKLMSEKNYVMVLLPDEQNAPAPEGFESCTFSIEGKGIISAYQLPAREKGPAKESEFYLIYCMNSDGEKGWYMYDSVEGTFQRYFAATLSVQTGAPSDDSELSGKYAELEKELNAAKMTQYIIIAVAAVIILILIIIIVVLILKNRSDDDDGYWDDVYDEDEEEGKEKQEDVVETIVEAAPVIENKVESVEDDEDDEIEIEFYNMEEAILEETVKSEKVVTKDDDSDLEFIDFE